MKRSKPAETPRPQIGDYFASRPYDSRGRVHMKIGPHWMDDAYITGAATQRGAERLAALMNAARDLARDYSEIATSSPYKGLSTRDWVAHCIAASLCEAVDTPLPYFDWSEEARYSLLYFDPREGITYDLIKFFQLLDAAGTAADLDDGVARRVLLKHSTLGRRHFPEVIRAWRRSFNASVPAAERAAMVLAEARAEDRKARGLSSPEAAA
ncbi:hypothetical protein SAMN05216337_1001225 [Bradyrhizobium brasilense]|uniref:Uncharacterized protein n=1 Tax=Bradyrhizobium brasilense TaxID=1419277 RepID=A0A1G6IR24_9BRAD|nr:hypothetical protein [Bradyrhizobium brasilense]SDC08880.1 hypothetical protein SAMN05216337_1001225 [Bradyrhizobium brasilense]